MTSSADNPSRLQSGYRHESARPLVSLVFVIPMLIAYEVGMILIGPDALRNGADVWLRQFLDLLGFGQFLLLPLLTCGVLLGWHHLSRQPWTLRPSVLGGMLVESVLFGFVLLLTAQLLNRLFHQWPAIAIACDVDGGDSQGGTMGTLIGYFGAGIYEELLFRLLLIPAGLFAARGVGLSTRAGLITAIVASSLLFSAAHYDFVTAGGDAFDFYSFLFRFLAGVFFALLFIFRGFGIAAGSHALYDVFAALS